MCQKQNKDWDICGWKWRNWGRAVATPLLPRLMPERPDKCKQSLCSARPKPGRGNYAICAIGILMKCHTLGSSVSLFSGYNCSRKSKVQQASFWYNFKTLCITTSINWLYNSFNCYQKGVCNTHNNSSTAQEFVTIAYNDTHLRLLSLM